MQITLAIEASQPSGECFRMALGISVPIGLLMILLHLV